MYCIIKQETHHDSMIIDIFGPYTTQTEANRIADKLDAESTNFHQGHRLHRHFTRELEQPYLSDEN